MAVPSRGAFIVFEGIDRCGKTTQCSKLLEYLRSKNVDVELWRFPDRTTTLGTMINAYLSNQADVADEAIHLMFAANRWEKKAALEAALAAGKTLIVDRYAYSGIAYSSAKSGPVMNLEWCKAPDAGLPAPDAVLYLRLAPEASARRGQYGEERYEKLDFQTKVAGVFDTLSAGDDRWRVLNADAAPEEVHAQVVAEVDAALARVKGGAPLGKLWDSASSTTN